MIPGISLLYRSIFCIRRTPPARDAANQPADTSLLLFCCVVVGESVVESLKAKVEAGAAPAPCNNAAAAAPAAPAAPKQYLDQRLPVVVDDYHPPVGGFNPSHIVRCISQQRSRAALSPGY
jgi:hypothetical protein